MICFFYTFFVYCKKKIEILEYLNSPLETSILFQQTMSREQCKKDTDEYFAAFFAYANKVGDCKLMGLLTRIGNLPLEVQGHFIFLVLTKVSQNLAHNCLPAKIADFLSEEDFSEAIPFAEEEARTAEVAMCEMFEQVGKANFSHGPFEQQEEVDAVSEEVRVALETASRGYQTRLENWERQYEMLGHSTMSEEAKLKEVESSNTVLAWHYNDQGEPVFYQHPLPPRRTK